MKWLITFFTIFITACATKPVPQNTGIPPLSDVLPKLKTGLSLDEVKKTLAGNKANLKYTTTDKSRSVWEFHDRRNIEPENTLEDKETIIHFDNQGKITSINNTTCFLPDQEQPAGDSPRTQCYQKHLFPFEKQLTYNAIKRFLIVSNYQVEHSDAASEIISANGTHNVDGDKDKMMFIKLTIIFSAKENNTTEVVMSASFSISEKQSTWVQAGFAGVVIPVPLPFQKKEEWINTGIVTPRFYMNFYDALSNLIANEYLTYQEPKAPIIPVANNTTSPSANTKDSTKDKAVESNKTEIRDTSVLPDFKGAIDSSSNLKKVTETKENTNNTVVLPEIKGAIDSKNNLEKVNAPTPNEALPEIKGAIDSDTNLNKFVDVESAPEESIENNQAIDSVKKKSKKKK